MKIIDVSHHNGKIDWQATSKEVACVFVKATEGSNYIDPMLTRNAVLAHNNGIKVGYYHFATLNSHDVENDAKNEATWFSNTLSVCPAPSLPLVLDLEKNKIQISKTEVVLYIQTFFRQLILHGHHDYMLYSYTSFLNDNLPHNHPFGVVKLWLADYNGEYSIPKGWDKVHIHQYTDSGKVLGIKGDVDLNRYIIEKDSD